MAEIDVPRTFGALFLGGLFGTLLSGVVLMLGFVYFKIYGDDSKHTKCLVSAVCFLDLVHTVFIWSGLWGYCIKHFGDVLFIEFIRWDIAATVVVTAFIIIIVHLFYARRIWLLSNRNWYFTAPLLLMIVIRFASATATTIEMTRLGKFPEFKSTYRWLFTFGLAMSSAIDVIITVAMFVLLRMNRNGAGNVNHMIDSVLLYAFEMGTLTTVGTIASMVTWLVMDYNLIFMGLHFFIAKFYAISILVALNTRNNVRNARSGSAPILYLDTNRQWAATNPGELATIDDPGQVKIPRVNIVRRVRSKSSVA